MNVLYVTDFNPQHKLIFLCHFTGRPWRSVTWAITPSTKDTLPFQQYLNRNFDPNANIVRVPSSVIFATTYQITVTMTNFLDGVSTATSTLAISGDRNLPQVTITGSATGDSGGSITTTAKAGVSLSGSAVLSSCGAASNSLNYTWFFSVLSPDGVPSSAKNVSQSKDPTVFYLPAYTLLVGRSYLTKLTVYVQNAVTKKTLSSSVATTTVFVQHGVIKALYRGADTRQVPTNQPLVIDASVSYDEDYAPGHTILTFAWTCTIVSSSNLGAACSFSPLLTKQTTSTLTLAANAMTAGQQYAFVVTVSSADGTRSATNTVSVFAVQSGVPLITMKGNVIKFNTDNQLNVLASITANSTVDATWTVFTSTNQPFDTSVAVTQPHRIFSPSEASKSVSFPLSFPSYTFTDGLSYTFRLTTFASPNTALSAASQVTVLANIVPYGGYSTVSPHSGVALSTTFDMTTSGWSDDDFVHQYMFMYSTVTSNLIPPLLVRGLAALPYATSKFPSGLKINAYNVTVIAYCVDPYSSAGNSTSVIAVTVGTASTSSFLKNALAASLLSGNSDSTYQAINLASSSLSTVNCTLTSPKYCASLNRADCVTSSNTCGSCLAGYRGIVGDSNAPCFSTSSTTGAVGSPCKKNSDCLYAECNTGLPVPQCIAPNETCPSNSLDNVGSPCSGHGKCLYLDTSGSILKECLVTNPLCVTKCSCASGYGGVDCALDAKALADASVSRVSMCTALLSGTQ